jgi:membrane protein DedA with SNARE-associated domain
VVEDELLRYGYAVLLLGSIIEGDATVLSAAFLANRGYFPLHIVILIAAGATTAANQVYYVIAKCKGHSLERKAALHHRYRRIYGWIQKRAGVLLVFSRFIYGLRIAIPAACGAVGMGSLRFLVLNLVGAFVWAIPIALLGYFFGETVALVLADIQDYDWQIAVGIGLAVAVFLLNRHLNDIRGATTMITHPEDLGEESTERLEGIYHKAQHFEQDR